MRQVLPAHWTPKALALEVNPSSTPQEIIDALNELAEDPALIAFLPDGRIEVFGIKSIHRALEAWKDKDDESISNRLQSFPIETKRLQSTVDVTLQDGTGRDVPRACESPLLTGRDVPVESKGTDSPRITGPKPAAATTGSQISASESNDTDTAPEHVEARKECDRITGTWSWKHFKNASWLRLKISSMLRGYDTAQLLLGHVYDVEADSKLNNKPAALLARLNGAAYPPGDVSMAAAKAVLARGDVPLDDALNVLRG
jgi:hypothetical protein